MEFKVQKTFNSIFLMSAGDMSNVLFFNSQIGNLIILFGKSVNSVTFNI